MITLTIPQRSIEWITARLWRLTASRMSTVITATGKLSKSEASIAAIDKLIAGIELANVMNDSPELADMDDWKLQEFMSHYTGDNFKGNHHTRRGQDCEPDAIAALSERISADIADVGMCIMGDNPRGVISCSPDGLVYDGWKLAAGCEVKAPCLATFYGQVARGGLPDEYKLQVHSSMAICEVDRWHFASYFKGQPLFYVEVRRDCFTDTVAASLAEFRDVYAARYEVVTKAIEALGKGVV